MATSGGADVAECGKGTNDVETLAILPFCYVESNAEPELRFSGVSMAAANSIIGAISMHFIRVFRSSHTPDYV